MSFGFFFFLFWDKVYLCSPAWVSWNSPKTRLFQLRFCVCPRAQQLFCVCVCFAYVCGRFAYICVPSAWLVPDRSGWAAAWIPWLELKTGPCDTGSWSWVLLTTEPFLQAQELMLVLPGLGKERQNDQKLKVSLRHKGIFKVLELQKTCLKKKKEKNVTYK